MTSFSEFSRRDLLKAAASAGVAAASSAALGQTQPSQQPGRTTAPGTVFYYVDGYHGGVDGHMPKSSLPNVLDGLDKFPHWKVSFEIEPYSWAVFARSDPHSIERLTSLLSDATAAGRVEIVSGAYGQPYMWNASGECTIRQLAFGLAELRAAFPGLVVDTYAVQEPCWTSCLPQILKSFGYRRAVLKDSTCWGGYHAPTVDADLMHWVGPDGTAITTVPRYAVEHLVPPATEEGAQPTAGFIERCIGAGIEHPAGTILQDMGWPGRPWRLGMTQGMVSSLRHVTWREYVDTIASPPTKQWKASQDDLRVGLPWGASVLQRIAQIVRLSEHLLVRTEKIASMALVRRGRPFPSDDLKQPWKDLLWSQHHDVWIVSQNRHGNGTWATTADAKRDSIELACARMIDESIASMAPMPEHDAKAGQFVRVFNTTGFGRRDLASTDIPAGNPIRIVDAHGQEVACQMISGSGGESSSKLAFLAEAPALGYATYQIAAGDAARPQVTGGPTKATQKPDGTVTLETDLFEITLDAAKGGRVTSLVAKDLKRQFVDATGPRSFNEFRGYFPTEGKWLSSVDAPATVSILEPGPVRATAEIRGHIGNWPFVTRVSAVTGQRRIDFQTTFEFPVDGPASGDGHRQGGSRFRLGEPWEAGRDTVRSNRRPFYDSSFKLQALFPASLRSPTLDKNGPFDVCRSAGTDTQFDAWDSIKNNLIFNWIDLLEDGGGAGMAVMTDHLTSYSLKPGEPLGLVMCYAGSGIWHDYHLNRAPQISYAIVPHAGNWAQAQLWQELDRWSEPLITWRCVEPAKDDSEWSLLSISDSGIIVSTAFAEDGHVFIRLFNGEGSATPKRLTFGTRIRRAWLVELDGRTVEELPVERTQTGSAAVSVAMGRFAVRTLRCELA